ncbi:hypothetical protein ACHAQJ_004443 [Trichoderma viride]
MASSQETPQMTERTAQNVAVPAPTHSLPQEMIAAGYQPYYQPYPGQQIAAPPPVETSKATEFTKLALHGVAVLLGAIGLGLSLASLSSGSLSVAIAACPASGIAMLRSLAEVITRAVRKFKRGIHPGAHVGMCLIIWMIASITGGMLCTYVAVTPLEDEDENDSNCIFTTYDSEGNEETFNNCAPQDPYPRGKILGAAVITCLIFALFFGLFIDACICTHRRNTAAKRPIMMIAQPQNWTAAAQGWQPMAQNDASTEAVQVQTPAAAKEPAIREYYAPA